MSFKSKESAELSQRLDMVEHKLKKLNMLNVYVKQILEMEKRLSQFNGSMSTKDLEKKLVPLFEETVKAEFVPVQYAFQDVYKRMIALEQKMTDLEKWAEETTAEMNIRNKESRVYDADHRVLFQEITVDKLFVDKYEQVNNVGSLGVKELSGQMNIGATFENSSNPGYGTSGEQGTSEEMEKWQGKMKKFKAMKEKYGIDENNENKAGEPKGRGHQRNEGEEKKEQPSEKAETKMPGEDA